MKYLQLVFLMLLVSIVNAQWDDCPSGEVNCEGLCGRFVDTDSSGYCDHSEPAPEIQAKETVQELSGQDMKAMTVKEVASYYSINIDELVLRLSEYTKYNVLPGQKIQLLHDNYGAEPTKIKEIALGIKSGSLQPIEQVKKSSAYALWSVVIITTALYLLSYVLAKTKRIGFALHKKIWNILLFISFFISGVLGMLLVIRIVTGWVLPFPFNMLYWHVEAGIVLFMIAVFHMLWHLDYFKGILKNRF
ncbi:MAG: hypothetical protein HGA85_01160 [Nanoarchaeota archaeon]|nr:hypothetical protein [Nanoarchaeota archaeon]